MIDYRSDLFESTHSNTQNNVKIQELTEDLRRTVDLQKLGRSLGAISGMQIQISSLQTIVQVIQMC